MRHLLSILTPTTNGGPILQRSGSLRGQLSQMVVLWCLCKGGISVRGIKYIFHFFLFVVYLFLFNGIIQNLFWMGITISIVFATEDLRLSY